MKPAALAAALVALACCAKAQAQSFSELALDGRPDRLERLAAGANKEGALTLYTSIPEKDMAVLAADFDRRYGVKVNVWRASSVKVLQRAAAEARANRWDFDAAAISSPEMEAMHRELLLQEVRSGHHANLAPDAMPSHRAWVPQFLNVFVQAYNTSLVRKEDLPKSYAELADPRWKGRLGVEASDSEWYCGVSKRPPHPSAALLFYEYLISDAQPLMVKMNYLAADARIASSLRGVKVRFIDPRMPLEELERCAKAFDDLNGRGALRRARVTEAAAAASCPRAAAGRRPRASLR